MFWALTCPSSGGQIVLSQHPVSSLSVNGCTVCQMTAVCRASNMAAPPSLNLLGEIGLLSSLVSWSWCLIFVLVLSSFFSAAYTLYLYSYSQHVSIYSGLYCCSLGYVREFLLLFLHWFPLNLIILKVDVTAEQSVLIRHTAQPFTDSDDTICCDNTICPPEDGHVDARNMLRIVV